MLSGISTADPITVERIPRALDQQDNTASIDGLCKLAFDTASELNRDEAGGGRTEGLIEIADQQRATIELGRAVNRRHAGSDLDAIIHNTRHDGRIRTLLQAPLMLRLPSVLLPPATRTPDERQTCSKVSCAAPPNDILLSSTNTTQMPYPRHIIVLFLRFQKLQSTLLQKGTSSRKCQNRTVYSVFTPFR